MIEQRCIENIRRLAEVCRAKGVMVIHVWFLVEPGALARTVINPGPHEQAENIAENFITHGRPLFSDLSTVVARIGSGRALARIAVRRRCGRMEWSVLRWNESAIRVYDAIGAEPLSGWLTYRLTGDRLREVAAGAKPEA